MKFPDYPIRDFLSALASKDAVPGGGGASALAGALGAALGCMVGNLTVGKARYKEAEPELYRLMEEARQLQERLAELIQADADGFAPLSRVYAMDKSHPDYAAEKERCLRKAAEAPLEIMELSCRMIELHGQFAEKGSKLAVSDAGTGAALCQAAMYGGALNVLANTKLMADRDYARQMNAQVEELMGRYEILAQEVYRSVYEKMKN